MDLIFNLNTVWVLVATALVFFMQAGFAMVETGFTRAKNASNIIMKNLMDFAAGSLVFFLIGFPIMFGEDIAGFIGSYAPSNADAFSFLGLSIPFTAFLIFQTVFCATAATIVSGAMSERTKFSSYLIYSIIISGLVYPVVGHWAWGGGFLSELGFHDFAGSTVVHSVGGWAALMGAAVLGPRIGKYDAHGKAKEIQGHNLIIGALGVFILWFGWFGFNAGSSLGVEDPTLIANVFVTTNLAASAGAVASMIYAWLKKGKPDVGLTLNGALAGLVGITAGCDVVSPLGAIAIGLMAGILLPVAISFIENKLKVDDPVGAIGVHGVCGAFGTLAVGLFDTSAGLLYTGSAAALAVQAIGVVAVAAWTIGTTGILFITLHKTVGLRVKHNEELLGLDMEEHGSPSYSGFVMEGAKSAS